MKSKPGASTLGGLRPFAPGGLRARRSTSAAVAQPAVDAAAAASSAAAAAAFWGTGARVPSPAGARIPFNTDAQIPSAAGQMNYGSPSTVASSSFANLLQSQDGFLTYMMNHPTNVLPENAHFVGHVGQQHNSPVDIESEDALEEDGDGVRTELRLIWNNEEDGRVMSAWLKHSIDSIRGNNKKGDQYWTDVQQEYNLTTPKNRLRTKRQVKERWHKINRMTNMFNDCWLKVRRLYTSGYSDEMWLEKAHNLYQQESKGSHFLLMNVWKMVRNEAKWISYNQSQIKRKEMEKDIMNEGGSGLEDIELPRPMGQKKAKKAAFEGQGKSKESAINVDELDRFEKIQNDVHANRLKVLEMQGKINNDKIEASKIALQRAKEEKDAKLIEKESKMMETYSSLLQQDTSGMADDMKAEHVAALICLRKKLFPELS